MVLCKVRTLDLKARKAKRKAKKVHDVRANLSVPQLAKAGSSLRLEIFATEEKIGELEIGRGSLYWYGRKRQRGKRVSWSRFGEMMDQLAYG